jgi:hypothetical protein
LLIASVMMLELLLFVTWDLMTICSVDSFLMCSSIPTQEEGLARCSDFLHFICGECFAILQKAFWKEIKFFFHLYTLFFGKGKEIAKIWIFKISKKKITQNHKQFPTIIWKGP